MAAASVLFTCLVDKSLPSCTIGNRKFIAQVKTCNPPEMAQPSAQKSSHNSHSVVIKIRKKRANTISAVYHHTSQHTSTNNTPITSLPQENRLPALLRTSSHNQPVDMLLAHFFEVGVVLDNTTRVSDDQFFGTGLPVGRCGCENRDDWTLGVS